MHNAPSVSYPVGRSRFSLALCAVAWTAGCAVIALWLQESRHAPWQTAMGCMLVLVSGAWAALSWVRGPIGRLAWNGSTWTWCSSTGRDTHVEAEVVLDRSLDAQRWLLLRLKPVLGRGFRPGYVWAWLDRSSDPSRWSDLRRAVYSRAKPDTLPGPSGPPAAKP